MKGMIKMKNDRLIQLIMNDLSQMGLIELKDILIRLNISHGTWWLSMTKGLISDKTLKKIAYVTKRPYSEYKKLKED